MTIHTFSVFFQTLCISRKLHTLNCVYVKMSSFTLFQLASSVLHRVCLPWDQWLLCDHDIVIKQHSDVSLTVWHLTFPLQTHSAYFWVSELMFEGKKKEWKNEGNDWKLSRTASCMLRVTIRMAKAGSVLRCGCGAETGQCQPGRSGSSLATYRRGKPPPPDELLPHGSPPPAAADWPPDERSQTVTFIYNKRWRHFLSIFFIYIHTHTHTVVMQTSLENEQRTSKHCKLWAWTLTLIRRGNILCCTGDSRHYE